MHKIQQTHSKSFKVVESRDEDEALGGIHDGVVSDDGHLGHHTTHPTTAQLKPIILLWRKATQLSLSLFHLNLQYPGNSTS